MKRYAHFAFLLLFPLFTMATRTAPADEVVSDLRRAVPTDAYLVVHGRHNPERDYQRVHYEQVFKTLRETHLVERLVEVVTSRSPEGERERALVQLEELKAAAAPIELQALLDTKEAVYAQRMEPFQIANEHGNGATFSTSQHLVLLRLTPEIASDYHRGITNMFQVMASHDDDKAAIKTEQHGTITLTTISRPGNSPYGPTFARAGDVFMCSSSAQFARESLAMLRGKGKPSKFDDPRLAEALQELPEPEDAVVFYDGQQQFDQIREMIESLHRQAGDNPEASRWVKLTQTILDEVAILDYLAVVEYTDGHRNCEETFGKLLPNVENRLLTEMLDSGELFVDWHRWVPADAAGYSLSSGADLHPLYRRVVSFIEDEIPEMQLPLENFEKWQRRIDLDLDVDLLQAFSGECVSVTLPADGHMALGGKDIVWATRCHKPARIGWLLTRLVDCLNKYPFIKAQNLRLVESEHLDGFQEISAISCRLFGLRPVIGFDEGWMFVSSSADAVKKVLDTRAGESESNAETPAFRKFELELDGPVRSVRFVNVAQQTRDVAKALRQAGAVMPFVVGLAEAQAGTDKTKIEELVPLRAVAELLPDLGKIIGEFDFMDSQLTAVQDGEQPGTWREYRVTLVPPVAAASSVTSN